MGETMREKVARQLLLGQADVAMHELADHADAMEARLAALERAEAERNEVKVPPSRMTVRDAARRRVALDGADAQALEGALSLTERERDAQTARIREMEAEVERLRGVLSAAVKSERADVVAWLRSRDFGHIDVSNYTKHRAIEEVLCDVTTQIERAEHVGASERT